MSLEHLIGYVGEEESGSSVFRLYPIHPLMQSHGADMQEGAEVNSL
jgi:hypothetical protein